MPTTLRVLVAAAALTLAGVVAVQVHAGPAAAGPARQVAVAALALAAGLALALQRGDDRPGAASRLAAPLLGFAGGMSLPVLTTPVTVATSLATTGAGSGAVAVVAGCAGAAVLAGVARISAPVRDGPSSVAMAAMAWAGGLTAVGILLSWPAYAVGAVLAGVVPVVVRLLPSLSLNAPEGLLVDTERLSTTVWSLRTGPPPRRMRVRLPDVERQFRRARDVVATGTVWSAVLAPTGLAVVLETPGRSDLSRWGALALAAVLAMGMGYQSRSVRDRLPRFALLASSSVLVLEALWALRSLVSTPVLLVVTCAVLGLGVLSAAGAAALGRGWRSTRLSRFADLLEGLSVALSLPIAILAADGIEALRRLTS